MNRARLVALLLGASIPLAPAAADDRPAAPVFEAGVPAPTRDKPQSKLWFAQGRWWAWLPVPGGSTVLERTGSGWVEHPALRAALAGLPGQADVWAEEDSVRAVLVGDDRLAVVGLDYDPTSRGYRPGALRHAFDLGPAVPEAEVLETATIARDSRGTWWVAYDRARSIRVLATTDAEGLAWGEPVTLGEGIKPDDISAVFALGDRVGVLWSDQAADAVFFREHLDGQPADRWGPRIAVEQGGLNADDHLNGVLGPDGTLYVATKNSVDTVGRPQQVLRIRRPDGRWENHPYADRLEKYDPSRPIALLGGEPPRLYLLHAIYDRRDPAGRRDFIAWQWTDPRRLDLSGPAQPLIRASGSVNNVTGPKRPMPEGAPWVVLASDAEGRVFEAILPPPR